MKVAIQDGADFYVFAADVEDAEPEDVFTAPIRVVDFDLVAAAEARAWFATAHPEIVIVEDAA